MHLASLCAHLGKPESQTKLRLRPSKQQQARVRVATVWQRVHFLSTILIMIDTVARVVLFQRVMHGSTIVPVFPMAAERW
jgi:hypothetical protein